MKKMTKNTIRRTSSLFLALIMVFAMVSPVFAREYYNYECRYTIQLSEEAYAKMSKVNEQLMSLIYHDGVSVTYSAQNYYAHLSDAEKNPELTSDDYSVGSEVFAATYNDAAYMKDEYFTKRLANVSGTTEMTGVTLVNINGFDFWEMTYSFFGEPAETAENEDKDDETAETAETPEDTQPTDTETPVVREDGLVAIGEGKMYFTVYKGFSYFIHMINREGKISDYPEMESVFRTINLGLRQSNVMKIMWIVIGVLCFILLALIIFTLTRKSPKKLAKLRLAAGLDENGKALPQTLAIEGSVEFDEEEQLRNNEFVNAKLEQIAKENAPAEDVKAEEDIQTPAVEETVSDEEINSFLDDQLEDMGDMSLELDGEEIE